MATTTSPTTFCPDWCQVRHHHRRDEDNRVHIGEAVALSGAILARLCMSVTADGQVEDGPYVLVGSDELTLEEARTLGETLIRMATQGAEVTPRATA